MKITGDKLLMALALFVTVCGYLALLANGGTQAEHCFLVAWFLLSQTKGYATFAQ